MCSNVRKIYNRTRSRLLQFIFFRNRSRLYAFDISKSDDNKIDDLCVLWGLIFGGPLTSSFLLLAVNKIYSRQRFNYAVMGCYTCDHAELLGDETKDAISLNGLDGNAPTGIIGMFRHITRIGSSEIPSIKPGNFPRCISVVYQSVTQLED